MKKKIYSPDLKNITAWLFLLPFLLILTGCPYSSPYKIDNEPTIPAEDFLVGKWATVVLSSSGNGLPVKMNVSKRNDYEYDLSFTGNIQALQRYNVIKEDTIKATAFISEAASRRFLNVQVKGLYYIVEFIYKNDRVSLLPLCEHFTIRMIKNNIELKQMLELHYKTRLYPLYDDEFCLKEMIRVN